MSVEYKLAILGVLSIVGVLMVRRMFRSSKPDSNAASENAATANRIAGYGKSDSDADP